MASGGNTNVPVVLRSGIGSLASTHASNPEVVTVLMSCMAEVFRSAYASAEAYAQHSAVAHARAVVAEDLCIGLNREISHADGAAHQLKPLFNYIVEHGDTPVDAVATTGISEQWLQRVLQHCPGIMNFAQRDNFTNINTYFFHCMTTGKNISELVTEDLARNIDPFSPAADIAALSAITESGNNLVNSNGEGSGSANSGVDGDDDANGGGDEQGDEGEQNDGEYDEEDDSVLCGMPYEDLGRGATCNCPTCQSMTFCAQYYDEWTPVDMCDSMLKDAVDQIKALMMEIAGSLEEGSEYDSNEDENGPAGTETESESNIISSAALNIDVPEVVNLCEPDHVDYLFEECSDNNNATSMDCN